LAVIGCIGVVAMALNGCARPESYTVTGQVRVDGKPAGGVYLAFYAADGVSESSLGSARSADDGSFALQLPSAGKYAVTAFWPSELLDEGAVVEGPDRFGGRYRNPRQPVATVMIQSGPNPLSPIDLKSR
jgi:hypothetical protein